jgi:type VI protein secretion system component VasK
VVAKHLHTLLETNESLRPVPLDATIIAQARNTLNAGLAAGPHLSLRPDSSIADDTARALRLDTAAGLGAEKVLRLRGGGSLAEPMPSIYTAPVFKEITANGTAAYVAQFASEYWVWGDAAPSNQGLAAAFERLPSASTKTTYIAAWDRVVTGIQAAPLSSLESTKEALAILGGAHSPLRGLLKVIDDNTYLVPPPEASKQRRRREGWESDVAAAEAKNTAPTNRRRWPARRGALRDHPTS